VEWHGVASIRIDLWEFDLNAMTDRGDWWGWLSDDERDRAQRYRRSSDRQQFVTARGLLRQCLGHYLNCAPECLQFHYGEHGKPEIDPTLQPSRSLQFNTSHSGEMALLAFSWDGAIGVDLEAPRSMSDSQIIKLARRFFLAPEVDALERCDVQDRSALFFRYWTCKEAYLKATGIGLSHLQQAPIRWNGDQPQPVIDSTGQLGTIQTIPLRCGYPAAIATIGETLTYRWQGQN
jgi:4'-phosphopantetheinyl transferase